MAIYEYDKKPENTTEPTIQIKEIPIYGSSRLGQYRPKTDAKKTALGQRIYEFSNHLGNVLVLLPIIKYLKPMVLIKQSFSLLPITIHSEWR